MALEVKKKQKESVGALLRRFSRVVQQSGMLIRVRSLQYHTRAKSKRVRKVEALKRIVWRKNMDRLRKLGKIE